MSARWVAPDLQNRVVRVLFSCVATHGHFHPLVPLARAFLEDGHDVAFATSASFGERVAEAGFDLLPAGLDQVEAQRRFVPYRERLEAVPIAERRPLAFTFRFGALEAPEKLGPLQEALREWGPDLLVYESADLAAPLAARLHDVPSVNHSFGRRVPVDCFERAADEVAPLWRDAGLEPASLCGAFDGTYVDICPPSFQAPGLPAGARIQLERPLFPAPPGASSPSWVEELAGRLVVYATLGTVQNDIRTFRLLLDGLAGVDATVVMTIGRDNDPQALAPLPPNAIVERYVPQRLVLAHASVVVAHGGSGSVLATFAHGLPSLLLPRGADQFDNAAQCAELGAGLVLLPGEVTDRAVHDAVATLLKVPSYRARAQELAAEIASMPDPREVVGRLIDALAP
jgi:UDP:flavonoid glycosyltransferase YjiC (YdhE family)